MKIILVISIVLASSLGASCQYYYLDVVGTRQTNEQHKKLAQTGFKKVVASSFEGNSQPSTDFKLEQTITNNGTVVVTNSATVNSGEAFFTSYFTNNLLVKTVDSSNNAINSVLYKYNDGGNLEATIATNRDFDGTLISTEQHVWSYYTNGKPAQMVKIINNTYSLFIKFILDEAGNVGEEKWFKNDRLSENWYYFFNNANNLTDIVRYNRKAKQMLPDFMFEYDAAGMITQMIQTQSVNANYLIWRYVYNPNGLKQREIVFNKQKELLGKIEYNYQ